MIPSYHRIKQAVTNNSQERSKQRSKESSSREEGRQGSGRESRLKQTKSWHLGTQCTSKREHFNRSALYTKFRHFMCFLRVVKVLTFRSDHDVLELQIQFQNFQFQPSVGGSPVIVMLVFNSCCVFKFKQRKSLTLKFISIKF